MNLMTQVIQWVFGFLSKRSTNMLMLLMLLTFNYKSTCFTKHFQRNPSPINKATFSQEIMAIKSGINENRGKFIPFCLDHLSSDLMPFHFLCNTEIFKGFFLCNSGFSIGCFCLVPEKGGILYNVSKNPFPKNHGPCYTRV